MANPAPGGYKETMTLKQELNNLKHLVKEGFNALERPFHSRAQKYAVFGLIYLGGGVAGVFDVPAGLVLMSLGILAKSDGVQPAIRNGSGSDPAEKRSSSKILQSQVLPQPGR